MPIIGFTQADALATVIVDNGYYNAIITEIKAPTASKSGKSVTYFTTVRITSGKFSGKELTLAVNSGSNGSSILGGVQYCPVGTFLQINAAVMDTKIEPKEFNLDTDTIINKPFDVQVSTVTEEGSLRNMITAFVPVGKGVNAAPVF